LLASDPHLKPLESGRIHQPQGVLHLPPQVLAAPGNLTWFAAGRDASGLTLVYVDANSSCCAARMAGVKWTSATKQNETLASCGCVWVSGSLT
jgi:hypothetical protein